MAIGLGRAPLLGLSSWGRREGCPWEARSWRDVDGRGRPPTASVLGLMRGADAAHALRYSLPRDTLPSAPCRRFPYAPPASLVHFWMRGLSRVWRECVNRRTSP